MALRPVSRGSAKNLDRKRKALNKVPKRAYTFFKRNTPIDTGNARKKTKFVQGNTIVGRYNYVNRLNDGYSKQAPVGMTDPTIQNIRSQVKRILG